MPKRDIHVPSDFFEYARVNGSGAPAPERDRIDVAVLDMNHSWPNVGHDAIVHAVLDAAELMRDALVASKQKVRVVSFDVRRALAIPDSRCYRLYIGTGGPGHLDPRMNDGVSEHSQGIVESAEWEAPLFRLFDDIMDEDDALIGICHSFGLMCRWTGIAHPELRQVKSSGMPENVLDARASQHPYFSQFAEALPDHQHFKVIDNRLFDLVASDTRYVNVIARERDGSEGVTVVEMAADVSNTMPRILGVNHHPEIIDREHIMVVLEEKRAHGEVTEDWYRERVTTMRDLFVGEAERQSRLTSEYTFLGPLRHHLHRLIEARCGAAIVAP